MPIPLQTTPSLTEQVEHLIELNLHAAAGLTVEQVRAYVRGAEDRTGLLVFHPDRIPASMLAPLVQVDGRRGFVVSDMTDVDDFRPIPSAAAPETPLYLLTDPDRGDAMTNWSPDEALPAFAAAGRTPMTLTEGLFWLLQRPGVLERGHCFMTIGSRRHKPTGALDPRTPAIWISNGTGRDGPRNRDAPKVGWCWAGNRHTWLGFASGAGRTPLHGQPGF